MKRTALAVVFLFLCTGTGLVGCDQAANEDTAGDQETQEQETDESADEDENQDSAGEEGDEESDGEQAEAPDQPVVGEPAPDFTLTDETGEEHTLSDYEGETVVLEWFNMECPYVQRHYEEGTFDNVLSEFGGTDEITWLAVDSSHDHTAETTNTWKEETQDQREYDYPVLQDADGEVGRLYQAQTTPHMFVIDEEGILRYMGGIDDDPQGEQDPAERENYVEMALTALENGEEPEVTEAEPYGCTVKYEEEDN